MADPTLGYRIKENLAERSNTPNTSAFHYRYPLTKLDGADDYLKITILKYTPPGFQAEPGSFASQSGSDIINKTLKTDPTDKEIIKGTILLPIPDGIADMNGVQWGPSTFNPIQNAIGQLAQGLITGTAFNDVKGKIEAEGSKMFNAAVSGSVQKYLSAVGITLASNTLLKDNIDLAQVYSRFAGGITNPNIELIFSGVTLREGFSFGFDIVPRGEKEAEEVKNIIRKLKYHSSAKKGASSGGASGLFVMAPEVFKIEYMNGAKPHPYLNKFKICALEGMSVNYTPNGNYATYYDGTPVNMQLTLAFKELSPIFAEDYETEEGKGGTGY